MTRTVDLIDRLVITTTPVKRLAPPWMRAGTWLLLALVVILALTALHGVRPDFAERIREPVFRFSIAASLLTGALAAFAALISSLPDRSRLWLLLPLPSAGVWLSTIGYGCLTNWVALDPQTLDSNEILQCFQTLLISSIPLSITMFWMLRHVAPLQPGGPILCASMAVGALTATALLLLHPFDASVMILLWTLGATALIVTVGCTVGRKMLSVFAKGLRPQG